MLINVLLLISFFLLTFIAIRFIYTYKLVRLSRVFLEITPTSFNSKTNDEYRSFINAVGNLIMPRSLSEKMSFIKPVASLDINSDRQSGIKYMLSVFEHQEKTLRSIINSFFPEAKINKSTPQEVKNTKLLVIKQRQKWMFPISTIDNSLHKDPIKYLYNAIGGLDNDQRVNLKIMIRPIRIWNKFKIKQKILNNKSLLRNSDSLLGLILFQISRLLFLLSDLLTTLINPNDKYSVKDRGLPLSENEIKSAYEHQIISDINSKLDDKLYKVNIYIATNVNKSKFYSLKSSLVSTFSLYSNNYQELLISVVHWPLVFIYRLNYLRNIMGPNKCYLSSNELASIYHFPADGNKFHELQKTLSKSLGSPVLVNNKPSYDIYLGENKHQGKSDLVGLSIEERQRHMYVIGGTGNGKTTLLKYQIVQDIDRGKGLAVVDPHGDLAEEILGYIPKERIKDVIYINPDDLDHPVGINLLEIDRSLTGNDLLREKDLVTESVISVFRKIFSEDDSGGHRIEYVLRNTVQTALTTENPTIFTIFSLLNDPKYRSKVVDNLEDEDLRLFWRQELGKAGDFQRVKMTAGITAKVGRFLFSASARGMLSQTKSTIDFEGIMDEGKILICNLSKGLLGEDASRLFGVTILAKIQLAALKRARKNSTDRRDFFLYVDEFQNFATISFVQMLSEARKYRLYLTMAEQSTQQQTESRLVEVILANVGTVITFRSGSPNDERLILPLFKPYLEEGQIANLPAYNFYVRIASVEPYEPISARTILVDRESSKSVRNEAVAYSRNEYGAKSSEVEINKIKSEQFKAENKISKNTKIEYSSSV